MKSPLADRTLDQVYSDGQRDDTCGGGIYWSRNRQAADNDYKSVIVSGQEMILAYVLMSRIPRLTDTPRIHSDSR